MTYDAKLMTGLAFVQTRQAVDSTRKPFLVPDMFSKLKSGFMKKVAAIVSAGKPEVTIESEFAVVETPVLTEVTAPEKIEKTFKHFSSAQILDKYPLLDKVIKTMSAARKLAISGVFIGKLVGNTAAITVANQAVETLDDPAFSASSAVDNTVIIGEIKELISERDGVRTQIAELTERENNLTAVIDQKKTQFSITDDMLVDNVKTLAA